MTPHACRIRRGAVAIAAAVLTAESLTPATFTVCAAERTVLIEEFTNIWCGTCAHAGPALDHLLNVYHGSVAFVQYQVNSVDATPFGDQRWAFYDGEFTPTAVFDGVDINVGAVTDELQQYNIYRMNHFLPQRAVPTDVTLDIDAVQLDGPTFRIDVLVGIEPGGIAKDMRIFLVEALDHWPPSRDYHRNGFRQSAEPVNVTLQPGDMQTLETTLTFDATSWAQPENIRIIAWAQANADAGPAAVHQAATLSWPLVAPREDRDLDGFLNSEDNCPDRANSDQLDADEDGVGDPCDNCPSIANAEQADLDEDRIGDACDTCVNLHHREQADDDADNLGNACDICPDITAPAGVNAEGRSHGAIDLDCDVDLADLALLTSCLAGPGETPPADCDPGTAMLTDLDNDEDTDVRDIAVFMRNFTAPLASRPFFVGLQNCIECHEENHGVWLTTAHASAYSTLEDSGDGGNELCFPCHAVGYGQPGGFVDAVETPSLANVQCESCHGPGSNHASDPESVGLPPNLDSALCGSCHQSCHGLCGEDHHPQYEQWSGSAHASALWSVVFEPDFEDDCLRCHAAEARLAPEGFEPDPFALQFSVECVVCHDPHGGEHAGQLRAHASQLCNQCHTMENASPGQPPRQPQSEMLHGTGGYALAGDDLVTPVTEHWWGIPNECATCHVQSRPHGGPDQPVDSGHSFEPRMYACEPCHTESNAVVLVDAAREEFTFRLRMIEPYFDPADPSYVDPLLLPPEQQELYNVALFNYEFVLADRSSGSHNFFYACALLAEVESFVGSVAWPCQP